MVTSRSAEFGELSDIPDQHLQEPWRFNAADRIIGRIYPERLVDLKISTAAAKDTIYGARRNAGFYAAADAIQDKHGSRKSGIAITGQRPERAGGKRKSSPRKNPAQTEFDL